MNPGEDRGRAPSLRLGSGCYEAGGDRSLPFAAFAFRARRHEGRFRTSAAPSVTTGVKGTAGVRSPRASAASIHSR